MEETSTAQRPCQSIDEWLAKSDNIAQRDPAKAAVSAFGIGVLLSFLPIGAIVGLLTSAVLALARPILLVLGIVKASEFFTPKN